MKNLSLVCVMATTLLLASCGQQTPADGKADFPENATFNGGATQKLEIRPAAELPAFLASHPDIKAKLEAKGQLQEVLDLAAKGALQPQQSTTATYCTIDYATNVNFDEYIGGEAAMYCQYPFNSSTTLEVITRRSPDFAQVDGLARGSLQPSTSLFAATDGVMYNEVGQYFCTNANAFIVLTDGRYASSKQGLWDCINGY